MSKHNYYYFNFLLAIFFFQSCNKPIEVPIVTTIGVKDIGINSASAFGSITGSDITAKGICWDTIVNPSIEKKFSNEGEGSQSFSTAITNLLPSKHYYVRAYATNAKGTAYGDSKGFNTIASPTLITYSPPSSISYNNAYLTGAVTSTAFSPIMAGICYGTQVNPDTTKNVKATTGNYSGMYLYANNLTEKTVYHYRTFAVFSFGLLFGDDKTFTTTVAPAPPTVFTSTGTMQDNDGNTYKTITIGSQTWMAENLRTTKKSNGTAISYLSSGSAWNANTQGAYGYYLGSSVNGNYYGYLYNNYAINIVGLAPLGWHVPTYAEWQTLQNTLSTANPSISVVSQLIYNGQSNWQSLFCASTNYSNMKILPGGYRTTFNDTFIGSYAYFWTADIDGSGFATYIVIINNCTMSSGQQYYNYGMSVRLVKD